MSDGIRDTAGPGSMFYQGGRSRPDELAKAPLCIECLLRPSDGSSSPIVELSAGRGKFVYLCGNCIGKLWGGSSYMMGTMINSYRLLK